MAVINLNQTTQNDTYVALTTRQSQHIKPAMTVSERTAKRAFDIIVSSIVLFLVLPVLAVVALAIKLTSEGPVLFKQQRVGENGKLFHIYKFRSMVVNAANISVTDENGKEVHKTRHDPRVTPIGRIVRKTSLDELPQLINVLKGEMSLVGPRPLPTIYLDRYSPEQARRHEVRPGITGWAQVNGRNGLTWQRQFELDLWYVENRSCLLDLKILGLTILTVLRRENISEEGHATRSEFLGKE